MYLFVIYSLKVSVCLTLFYLFFEVLLSKETFHRVNRTVLLSLISLAFIVPIIPAPFDLPEPLSPVVNQLIRFTDEQATPVIIEATNHESTEETIASKPSPQHTTPYNYVGLLFATLLILYVCGAIVALAKLVVSMRAMRLHIKQGTTKRIGNYRLVIHPSDIAPYSWFRYILISGKDLQEAKDEILAHEMAHSDKFHSLDILLVELMIILQWFNPAAYLLKQELQAIHEYEADLEVLKQGFQSKAYQLLLIKKAVGTSSYTLANSFNHSTLKKRIAMMLKSKSNRWAMMKIGLFIPLTVSMLVVFSPTGNATDLLSVSANTAPETTEALSPTVPDTSKPFAQAKDATKTKPSGEVFLEYLVQGIYNSEILNNQDYYGNIWAEYTIDNDGKVKVSQVGNSKAKNNLPESYLSAVEKLINNTPLSVGKLLRDNKPFRYRIWIEANKSKRHVLAGKYDTYTFNLNKPITDVKYRLTPPPPPPPLPSNVD